MSRQGYAFARDGGLFQNARLTKHSPAFNLPFWSITLPSVIVALVGLIYLFSSSAYNAFVGSQVTCMIISFGSPPLFLLLTQGKSLPKCDRWNFGIWSVPIYLVSVGYMILVVIVSVLPQQHPVTASNMNYTILVMACLAVAMVLAWAFEGRRLFSPPTTDDNTTAAPGTTIMVRVSPSLNGLGTDPEVGSREKGPSYGKGLEEEKGPLPVMATIS